MDEIDQHILQILHADARVTLRDTATAVDRSINAVRDRIRKLEASGAITGYQARITPSVPNHAMAFLYRIMPGPEPPARIWDELAIAGVYAGPGRYPLMVHFQCGTVSYMSNFLKKNLYPSGYRIGVIDPLETPHATGPPSQPQALNDPWGGLDLHDLKIIAQLRRNGRTTMRNLAGKLELPETTVRDRVHRLERQKTLNGVTATTSAESLGFVRESWIIARGQAALREHVAFQLAGHPSILNVFCSSSHPNRLAIHAVGSSRLPLMDVLNKARFEFGLQVVHFQPVEAVLRSNPNDSFPGREDYREEQADHLAVAGQPKGLPRQPTEA